MNTLAFAIATSPTEDGTPYRALVITIDGVSLIEQVKHHEMPMATQENHPDIAGAYAWPPFSESLRSALRGVTTDEDGKVFLLICTCGEPGCWPLRARIQVNDETVSWHDFEQPHRASDSAEHHWRYDTFGPFVFKRSHYEAALASLPE